jgi:DNA polymerase (family 10)
MRRSQTAWRDLRSSSLRRRKIPTRSRRTTARATRIRALSESLDDLVREDADLTQFPGIGEAIASAIREIVLTGKLRKLETLRGQATPEVARLADYPRLDPKRVLRVYKKLKISSIEELREKLETGEIESVLGLRMAQHVRQGLTEAHAMLLYRADGLRDSIEQFLFTKCGVKAAQVVGACRRRVEVIDELAFVIQTDDFLP